jgi:DeoR/GlpR family transcriptional regulator of sugar metabolism
LAHYRACGHVEKEQRMYPAERRQEILRRIQQDAHVTVTDLAAHFGVSRSAVRRDLNELRNIGLLQRTYGGATGSVPITPVAAERPFSERTISQREEKERIGRAAAALVKPEQVIFLDGGTTVECMVPYLVDKPGLTVVTHGLNIANALLAHELITVIIIGGTLHRRSVTLGGFLALESIQAYNMRLEMAFIGAGGVTLEGGITNASLEEIPMKRKALEASNQNILLVDSSKVGVVTTGRIAPVVSVQRVITGSQAPAAEIAGLRRLGVAVELV